MIKKFFIFIGYFILLNNAAYSMEDRQQKRQKINIIPTQFVYGNPEDYYSEPVKDTKLKIRYKKNSEPIVDLRAVIDPSLRVQCIFTLFDQGLTEQEICAQINQRINAEALNKQVLLLGALRKANYRNEQIVKDLFLLMTDSAYNLSDMLLSEHLCEAAFVGDEFGIKLLICKGAHITEISCKALEHACYKGHISIVNALLTAESRMDVNRYIAEVETCFGLTENREIAALLADKEAALLPKNKKIAYIAALCKGEDEFIKFLVENKISPFKFSVISAILSCMEQGCINTRSLFSKLLLFEEPGKKTILTSLLQVRDNPDFLKEAVLTVLDEGIDINAQDQKGMTPLHWAVKSENGELVELFLEKGADLTRQNHSGATPLSLAEANLKAWDNRLNRLAENNPHVLVEVDIQECGIENPYLGQLAVKKEIVDLLQKYASKLSSK